MVQGRGFEDGNKRIGYRGAVGTRAIGTLDLTKLDEGGHASFIHRSAIQQGAEGYGFQMGENPEETQGWALLL